MNPAPPVDCWTCKHRRTVEYGPALAVGIVEYQCAKFMRHPRFPLTCSYAYDKFCGGGDWSPTLRAKFLMWWLGTKNPVALALRHGK